MENRKIKIQILCIITPFWLGNNCRRFGGSMLLPYFGSRSPKTDT